MKKKFFLRKFILFFLILILPILILGSSFYLYSSYRIKKDMNERAKSTSTLGNEHLELILQAGKEQTNLFDNTPALSLSIYKILNELPIEFKEYTLRSMIFAILENLKNSTNYIDSVYLYLDNSNGNYFQTDKKMLNISSSFDSEWINIYQNMDPENNLWIVKRSYKNYSFENEKPTISIFRWLNTANGVLVLNLEPKSLSGTLQNLQMYQSESIIITDSDGIPLFQNSNADLLNIDPETRIDLQLTKKEPLDMDIMYRVVLNDTNYILTEIVSSQYGLRFLSLVPESEIYRTLQSIIFFVIISTIFAFIICFALSYYLTQKSFRQINHILDTFWKAENGVYPLPDSYQTKFKDEYDVILNNVIHTFINNNALKFELKESQISKTTAELAALQLQINPHFLFNTLQTIDLEVIKQSSHNSPASNLIQNLSDILSYALGNPNTPVSLGDEILHCKNYVKIQHFRYPNKFVFIWDYEEKIMDTPIIRLLLQPLIENSLYHGIKPKTEPSFIRVKIVKKESGLLFFVLDNGVGMEKNRLVQLCEDLHQNVNLDNHAHIGLRNTQRRLVLTFGESAGLKITSRRGRGTCVSFFLPV